MSEIEPVIDIRDSEINVEDIMNRIRARVHQRRLEASAQGVDYDHVIEDLPRGTGSGEQGSDLLYDLHQLRVSASAQGVGVAMRDRKVPLLNPVLYRVEHLLHRLVVKYVNMLAGRQISFNQTSVHALTELTRLLEEKDARVGDLELQVRELKEELAQLRQSSVAQGR